MRVPPTTGINIGSNRTPPQPNNTPNVGPTQHGPTQTGQTQTGQTQTGQTQTGQTQTGQMLLSASVGTNANVALANNGAMGGNASVNTQVGDGRSTLPNINQNHDFQSMKNAFESISGKSVDLRSGFYPDDSFSGAEIVKDDIVYLREVTLEQYQGLDKEHSSASIDESNVVHLTEVSGDPSDNISEGNREIHNGNRTRPEFNSREGFLWEPTPFPNRQHLPTDFIPPTLRTSVDKLDGIDNLPTPSSDDPSDNIPDGKREI